MPDSTKKKTARRPKGPHRITSEMFYKHLRCPHWIYWDTHGEGDDGQEVGDIAKKIREQGVLNEREVVSSYGDFDEVPEYGDEDELSERTLELMRKGSRIIYHGRLVDANWVGTPDLLFRTTLPLGRRSVFGDYSYEPYDIKSFYIDRPEDVRDEFRFQLAFYALILEKVQGIRPECGHLIDAALHTADVRINDVLDDFHLTLREIEKILEGAKPAPFLASSCKESPWFGKCKLDAEACDDICLIYKIRRSDHAKLYEAGVKTVTELATANLDDLEDAVEGMSRRKLEALQRQALALHEHRVIVIEKNPLPHAETEAFFDIEGDPLRGTDCLFGLLVAKGKRAKGKYEGFFAASPDEEKDAWYAFLAFVKGLPDDAPIFHYGAYERIVVNRMSRKYGGDEEAIDRLERRMFNLLTSVCSSVAMPVYFYSLKDIAKELGFRWRSPKAGGVQAILWYEEYLKLKEKKGSAAKADKVMKEIMDYNEDDVRATMLLKRWLDDLPDPK